MRVSRMLESFSEEISHMSKTDEDHIAEIGRKQDVIGWVFSTWWGTGLPRGCLEVKRYSSFAQWPNSEWTVVKTCSEVGGTVG